MKKYNVSADWLIGGEAFNVGRNLAVGKIVVLPVLSARRRRIFDEQGWPTKFGGAA